MRMGGCIMAESPDRLSICFCTLADSAATYSGGLKSTSDGLSIFRYDNLTGLCAMQTYGALELMGTPLRMSFCICDQCFSGGDVPGIYMSSAPAISIFHVLFILLHGNGHESQSGAVLMLDHLTGDSIVEDTAFVNIQKLAGYTVYATGNMTLAITGCCFSDKLENEIMVVFPAVLLSANESSFFESECETSLSFVLPRVMGYQADPESATQAVWVDRVFKGAVVRLLMRSIKWALAAGSGFGIILWILIRRIPRGTRRRPRRRTAV
jgi:hypothetical protein